jgi:hypothetical protein
MATAGYLSTIKAGGTVVKDIISVDWPLKMNTADTTSFSSSTPGTESFIPTTSGATIKLSGHRNNSDTGQNAMRTAWINRTAVAMVFDPDGTGTETYTASCWVTDWAIKSDPKSAAKLDISLVVNNGTTIV